MGAINTSALATLSLINLDSVNQPLNMLSYCNLVMTTLIKPNIFEFVNLFFHFVLQDDRALPLGSFNNGKQSAKLQFSLIKPGKQSNGQDRPGLSCLQNLHPVRNAGFHPGNPG